MECPKKSTAAGLPDDPLVEILSRLSLKEIHRSKCVCKCWRDLVADPLHYKKLPRTLHGFFVSPSCTEELGPFINLQLVGGGSPPPVNVDPSSFSFIKKVPGIHDMRLVRSCNGLLLFSHSTCLGELELVGYIVFNPVTEQWAAVPSEKHAPTDICIRPNHACLVYDPTVSSHFHLVLFFEEAGSLATVYSYSSETGVWRHGRTDWVEDLRQLGCRRWDVEGPQISGTPALFNGMLYLILNDGRHVAEVDVEGKTRRIIAPPPWVDRPRSREVYVHGCRLIFIGQSVGRLHCIVEVRWMGDDIFSCSDDDSKSNLLSIWVLEDYDRQEWALKHTVSCLHLFGRKYYRAGYDYDVVAIHPDSTNSVFIGDYIEKELISYGFGSVEVRVVKTLKQYPRLFAPYVPCFLDFLSVTVVQHVEKLI